MCLCACVSVYPCTNVYVCMYVYVDKCVVRNMYPCVFVYNCVRGGVQEPIQIGYKNIIRIADWLFRLVTFFSADLQIGYSDWLRFFRLISRLVSQIGSCSPQIFPLARATARASILNYIRTNTQHIHTHTHTRKHTHTHARTQKKTCFRKLIRVPTICMDGTVHDRHINKSTHQHINTTHHTHHVPSPTAIKNVRV